MSKSVGPDLTHNVTTTIKNVEGSVSQPIDSTKPKPILVTVTLRLDGDFNSFNTPAFKLKLAQALGVGYGNTVLFFF
jgi:hypothetical protein